MYVTEKEAAQLDVVARWQEDSVSNVLRRMFKEFYIVYSEQVKPAPRRQPRIGEH